MLWHEIVMPDIIVYSCFNQDKAYCPVIDIYLACHFLPHTITAVDQAGIFFFLVLRAGLLSNRYIKDLRRISVLGAWKWTLEISNRDRHQTACQISQYGNNVLSLYRMRIFSRSTLRDFLASACWQWTSLEISIRKRKGETGVRPMK